MNNKTTQSNNLTFFLITVIILVVVIYHCHTKSQEHFYKREAFQNDKKTNDALDKTLNKTLRGTKANKNDDHNVGNSIVPIDENNIIVKNVAPDFNSKPVDNENSNEKNDNTQKK